MYNTQNEDNKGTVNLISLGETDNTMGKNRRLKDKPVHKTLNRIPKSEQPKPYQTNVVISDDLEEK